MDIDKFNREAEAEAVEKGEVWTHRVWDELAEEWVPCFCPANLNHHMHDPLKKDAFELEQRYIVLKISDLELLKNGQIETVLNAVRLVDKARKKAGKGKLEGLFIENDWPEYGPSLELLSRRVNGEQHDGKKVGECRLALSFDSAAVENVVKYIVELGNRGAVNKEVAEKIAYLLSQTTMVEVAPDANVEQNRKLLLERSKVGLKKYGVTTERDDLTPAQWAQHAIEEALDFANYLQALKSKLEPDNK